MSTRYLAVGIFLIAHLSLIMLGLFFVGDSHEAFSRHVPLYTELRDVDGLMKGSKVRVGGMDPGEIVGIEVPNSPQSPFRIEMRINERLHSLVRRDSLVTEALKHNFFFRGFFNKRGYYNLSSISPQEYRRSKLFTSRDDQRTWLAADLLFQNGPNGDQELTQTGKRLIDETIVDDGDAVFGHPVVI